MYVKDNNNDAERRRGRGGGDDYQSGIGQDNYPPVQPVRGGGSGGGGGNGGGRHQVYDDYNDDYQSGRQTHDSGAGGAILFLLLFFLLFFCCIAPCCYFLYRDADTKSNIRRIATDAKLRVLSKIRVCPSYSQFSDSDDLIKPPPQPPPDFKRKVRKKKKHRPQPPPPLPRTEEKKCPRPQKKIEIPISSDVSLDICITTTDHDTDDNCVVDELFCVPSDHEPTGGTCPFAPVNKHQSHSRKKQEKKPRSRRRSHSFEELKKQLRHDPLKYRHHDFNLPPPPESIGSDGSNGNDSVFNRYEPAARHIHDRKHQDNPVRRYQNANNSNDESLDLERDYNNPDDDSGQDNRRRLPPVPLQTIQSHVKRGYKYIAENKKVQDAMNYTTNKVYDKLLRESIHSDRSDRQSASKKKSALLRQIKDMGPPSWHNTKRNDPHLDRTF